jgi:nucleotide-binding universal stress UspA family protein
MKTILLPTDFSKNSINAIEYAVKCFEYEACKFYLLNVQRASSFISDDMMLVSSSTTIYNTLIDAAKKSLLNIVEQLKKTYQNNKHEFDTLVDYDNFIDSINQTCTNNSIDLIVMGTKGASGLDKVLFGSNTIHVIQRCYSPVLAVPDGCKFDGLQKIAFTSSFTSKYEIDTLKPLKNIIKMYNATLNILHVAKEDDDEESIKTNIQFFESNFPDVKFDYLTPNSKSIYKHANSYIAANNINMIVMMRKKHSFLNRLFNKHLVEELAFKVNIPFFVLAR